MAKFLRQMSLSAAASFARRLGTGLHSGVGIMRLLEVEMKYGSQKHQFRVGQVYQKVKKGESLSNAMLAAEGYFPQLLVQMIHVGETTGRLERTILEVARLLEHRIKLRRIFIGGILWPMIQLTLGILVVGGLIWLQGILAPTASGPAFDALGLGLYGNRGAAIYFSFVGCVAVLIGTVIYAVVTNAFGLSRLIPYAYKIPVVGPALQTISLSRICWTLSLTLDAGLDVIRSVRLALASAGSAHYEAGGERAEQAIRNGASLTGAFAAADVFPREFLEAMETAELSGTDAESLSRLASNYDDRAKMALGVLVGVSTAAIWVMVAGLLVFVIMRIALQYIGMLNSALEM